MALDVGKVQTHLKYNLVFVGTSKPAQFVEEIIASTVWCKAFQEWEKFGIKRLTLFPEDIFFPDHLRWPYWEIVVALLTSKFHRSAVYRLIQRVAKVVERVGSHHTQRAWNSVSYAIFENLLSRLSIELNDWECDACVNKSGTLRIQLLNISLSSVEEYLGTFEGIGHEEEA